MSRFLKPASVKIFEKQTDPNDTRLKNIFLPFDARLVSQEYFHVGILGIPFDLGVKNSKGRVGAGLAPDAIRQQIKRYGNAYNAARCANLRNIKITDCGNIITVDHNPVVKTHTRVWEMMKLLFGKCEVIIVLGGGNDLSNATISALSQTTYGRPIGGINVDAHLDVREQRKDLSFINSGMPYRLLIQHEQLAGSNLFEVGIQGHVNSKHDWDWAKQQGVHILTLKHLRQIEIWSVMSLFRTHLEEKKIAAAFVSIDIDSVAQAFAPGSSAPNPDGLFPEEILKIAYIAGTMPQVRLFEIMEVNPLYDQDNRTSRLAANIILEFLAGYTQRKKPFSFK